ncbi:hypothetical protein DEO72_LG4g2640 [Vigna unguiculata]|uniref:Uncharacterized protein n=1 Tax=Vigna unguiculata TaxID=3917 RepID=A0A4D6LT80_VIGUN|nr:hypothetical protein DEO72_LG4g2640 [Vigna unguiculata]
MENQSEINGALTLQTTTVAVHNYPPPTTAGDTHTNPTFHPFSTYLTNYSTSITWFVEMKQLNKPTMSLAAIFQQRAKPEAAV